MFEQTEDQLVEPLIAPPGPFEALADTQESVLTQLPSGALGYCQGHPCLTMHAGDQILAGLAQKLFGHSYRQTRKIPLEQAAFLHSGSARL